LAEPIPKNYNSTITEFLTTVEKFESVDIKPIEFLHDDNSIASIKPIGNRQTFTAVSQGDPS
jgi:hypothetical protein